VTAYSSAFTEVNAREGLSELSVAPGTLLYMTTKVGTMTEDKAGASVAGNGEMIVYRRTGRGGSAVQLKTAGGTVWLTYEQMADLYATTRQNIVQIVGRVLADGEVGQATCNSELQVRQEGSRLVRRSVRLFSLDMILAVGYRVSTPQAVMFRQWATTILKEYLTKGFALDDERLKNPGREPDYFDELLTRIRAIRSSEKRFYQKVRDLFAATSSDYDPSSQMAKDFFATIQNKLLFAVTGQTAAELVRARIRVESATFGLMAWQGERPMRADAVVAKNYLAEDELTELDTLTSQFLDFAEGQARRRLVTTMAQWAEATDRLLAANRYNLLHGRGSVSHDAIEKVVSDLWPAFAERRRQLESDEAWETEAADITELLQFGQARGEDGAT